MLKTDSFVKFEKVDKSYDGEILVVKDLNLDVPKRRIFNHAWTLWFWKNYSINDA